jgi:hypothetical protein
MVSRRHDGGTVKENNVGGNKLWKSVLSDNIWYSYAALRKTYVILFSGDIFNGENIAENVL